MSSCKQVRHAPVGRSVDAYGCKREGEYFLMFADMQVVQFYTHTHTQTCRRTCAHVPLAIIKSAASFAVFRWPLFLKGLTQISLCRNAMFALRALRAPNDERTQAPTKKRRLNELVSLPGSGRGCLIKCFPRLARACSKIGEKRCILFIIAGTLSLRCVSSVLCERGKEIPTLHLRHCLDLHFTG